MTPAIRSTNPFYPLIYTTPVSEGFEHIWPGSCIENKLACHCFEVFNYFGTSFDRQFDLPENHKDYIEKLQNTIGNFIRTGDPNNWEGNDRDYQEIVQIDTWRDSKMFTMFGIDGQYPENFRNEYCNKLDDMWEYMMH